MIARAIESWLTKTNERNYQIPFCQVLLQQGHKVIYISSHGQMEQGKDIITIGPEGNYCAYQLKTGHLDLAEWRKIYSEIRELIEIPIQHPSVDKSKGHKSYLVTNGELADTVRIQIQDINGDSAQRGFSTLDTITGQALLKMFLDAQGEFIPKGLEEFQEFLKLFLAGGDDFLPKEEHTAYLHKTFFTSIPAQKNARINAICAAVIMNAYVLNPYQAKQNHYAVFEAWTCLAAEILGYACRADIDERDFLDSLNLVRTEIIRSLTALREEMLKREDFLEGNWMGDGGLIYRARVTLVLGALAALELCLCIADKKYVLNPGVLDLVKRTSPDSFFLGETAFPHYFSMIKFLELGGDAETAMKILGGLFVGILNENSGEEGIPNPYYSPSDVLGAVMGTDRETDKERIDFRQFSGGSYVLEPMILMLTRRKRRDLLEKHWRRVSHMQFKRFEPAKPEDLLAWRTKDGSNISEFPHAAQSWAALQARADSPVSKIPDLLSKQVDLMLLFILTYPHRANLLLDALDRSIAS